MHPVIQSVKGKLAERAMAGSFGKGFPSDLVKRTRAMLTALDAAVELEDLRFPPGNHLEALKGYRSGQHSVRINRQWRICFRWTPNGPEDVEIVDCYCACQTPRRSAYADRALSKVRNAHDTGHSAALI